MRKRGEGKAEQGWIVVEGEITWRRVYVWWIWQARWVNRSRDGWLLKGEERQLWTGKRCGRREVGFKGSVTGR